MKKLSELFNVEYGNKLDMNKMKVCTRTTGGVSFVGRADSGQGVTGVVALLPGLAPYPAGLITVALGGRKALASFVQTYPFYTAQNVAVLTPKQEMTFAEKVFYCISIRHNRFRYSTCGREANRTLRELLLPDTEEFPHWVVETQNNDFDSELPSVSGDTTPPLDTSKWKLFTLSELFDIKRGQGLVKTARVSGGTPYIGAIDGNNGLVGFVTQPPLHRGGTITLNGNGSIGFAFFQPVDYWCSGDVSALYPRFEMTPFVAIFLATVISRERYRFNFGRKWTLKRMSDSTVAIPVTATGAPDWGFMEQYIKTLPFSSQL